MEQSLNEVGYDPVRKFLHWVTVAMVLALLLLGWVMTSDLQIDGATRGMFFAWHKSLGVLLLFASVFRLYWRATHTALPLPATMRPWEVILAETVHKLLYLLLFLQPLVGWSLYSVAPHKTDFFGIVRIPDLPFLSGSADSETLQALLGEVHGALAAFLAVLMALHGAAAFKHHFLLGDDVLLRMAPARLGPLLRKLRGERWPPRSEPQ